MGYLVVYGWEGAVSICSPLGIYFIRNYQTVPTGMSFTLELSLDVLVHISGSTTRGTEMS